MFAKFYNKYLRNSKKGAVLIAALTFLTILSIVGLALTDLVISQNKLAKIRIAEEYSFQIAEAGLNYARWRLAHNPADFSIAADQPLADPEGGTIGYYNIDFTPPSLGENITSITATGWYGNFQNLERIVAARYGKKAFTFYAFLFDSPVWFGGPAVDGRVHSNNGIRMDSTGNAKITSAKESYTCTAIHGCDPPMTKPGIWGSGGNQNLWAFPVSNIDFNGVTTDLSVLKDLTEKQAIGLFLPKQGIPKGYDLNFLANGTVEIYKVNTVKQPVTRYRWEDGSWKRFTVSLDIDQETLIADLSPYILAPNDLIFAETDVWVRGAVRGRLTVVAAKLPDVSSDHKDIIIGSGYNNLTYANYDGSSVLGLIAQRNILISLEVPNNLRIDGVLMAQKGFIGRDYYPSPPCCRIRNSITTFGSMISKDFSDPEFRWVNYAGQTVGGFNQNLNSYDSNLTYDPPPYFPVFGDYDFISWEEKEKSG